MESKNISISPHGVVYPLPADGDYEVECKRIAELAEEAKKTARQ